MESLIKPLLFLAIGIYWSLVGFGFHTPSMKKEPSKVQLKLLRISGAIVGPAMLILGVLFSLESLGLL